MNAGRRRTKTARAARRGKPKRAWLREYRRDAARVIELARRGFSPSTIAATVRLDERLVTLILEKAGEGVDGEGVVLDGRLRRIQARWLPVYGNR